VACPPKFKSNTETVIELTIRLARMVYAMRGG
jgi:hypothetical protein